MFLVAKKQNRNGAIDRWASLKKIKVFIVQLTIGVVCFIFGFYSTIGNIVIPKSYHSILRRGKWTEGVLLISTILSYIGVTS